MKLGAYFAALMSQSNCSSGEGSGQGSEERRLALLHRSRRANVIIDYPRVSPWVVARADPGALRTGRRGVSQRLANDDDRRNDSAAFAVRNPVTRATDAFEWSRSFA